MIQFQHVKTWSVAAVCSFDIFQYRLFLNFASLSNKNCCEMHNILACNFATGSRLCMLTILQAIHDDLIRIYGGCTMLVCFSSIYTHVRLL